VNNDRISLIIPAKNEEKNIGEIIEKSRKYANEIIVIDGHSGDATREIANEMGVKVYLDNGRGKGDAIRVGIEKSQKEILVFIDADGSHDPDDIPKMVYPIFHGEADHVSTSRMRGGSDELHGDFFKFIRLIGSEIITIGINSRFGVKLTDSQNGMRAIKKNVAMALGLKEDITTIEQEMIIKTLRKGYRLIEIPAHEYARKHGYSNIQVRKVWFRYVFSWLKYLFVG